MDPLRQWKKKTFIVHLFPFKIFHLIHFSLGCSMKIKKKKNVYGSNNFHRYHWNFNLNVSFLSFLPLSFSLSLLYVYCIYLSSVVSVQSSRFISIYKCRGQQSYVCAAGRSKKKKCTQACADQFGIIFSI